MTLPIDRTTLALAQGNQVPYQVASATKNINFLTVVANTIDELNAKVDAHTAAALLPHADGSVSTAKIADQAVTTPKLAELSVTNAKVANATLDATKFIPGVLNNETQNGLLIAALSVDVMQRGINPMSSPYNAVGDGVSDDTTPMFNAITYCIANQVPLLVPAGTFILNSAVMVFEIPSGSSFVMFGFGELSVLKRKSGSIAADFKNLLQFTPATGSAAEVYIYNVKFDSNGTGNPLAGGADPYVWQHCATLNIGGSSGKYFKHVKLENLWFTDAVADHIYFPGSANCYVKTANINGIFADDRTRTRSDITITGGMEFCNISNINIPKIDVELNVAYDGAQRFVLNINNAELRDSFDIAGNGDTMILQANNVKVRNQSAFQEVRGFVSNSTLRQTYANGDIRLNYCSGLTFNDVDFYFEPSGSLVNKILVVHLASTFTKVNFKNCRHYIDSAGAGPFTGYAVYVNPVALIENSSIEISDCWYDLRYTNNIYLDRCDRVRLTDNDYSGSLSAVHFGESGSFKSNFTLQEGGFSRVTGFNFDIGGSPTMRLNTTTSYVQANFDAASSGYQSMPLVNGRVVIVTARPTTSGIKGDVYKLDIPVLGAPCEWLCITTHKTAATWVMTKQAGIKKSTTANRPVPSSLDFGVRYLDTTLDADGKMIEWNGTAWVDATGAVV